MFAAPSGLPGRRRDFLERTTDEETSYAEGTLLVSVSQGRNQIAIKEVTTSTSITIRCRFLGTYINKGSARGPIKTPKRMIRTASVSSGAARKSGRLSYGRVTCAGVGGSTHRAIRTSVRLGLVPVANTLAVRRRAD